MSKLRIIRTNHLSDANGTQIVRNYFVVADGYVSENELDEELAIFAEKHRPKPTGNINVLFYTNSESASVENYTDLSGEQFLTYAEEHTVAYCMGVVLKYPMKGDAFKYINDNFERVKDMTVESIMWDMHKAKLIENNDNEQLKKVIAFENDKS